MGFTAIALVASPGSVKEICQELANGKALRETINPLWGFSEDTIAIMFAHGKDFDPVAMAEVISLEWPDCWIKVNSTKEDFSISSNVITPKMNENEKPYVEIDIKVDQNLANIGDAVFAIKEYFGKDWFYEEEKWAEFVEYEFEGIKLGRHPMGDPAGDANASVKNYDWLD